MPKMDEAQKAAKIDSLQSELTQLIAAVRTQTDEKTKRKMIGEIGNLNRQIDKIKSGRLLSRGAKRDLVAYSFIAPNFIGFCVFTLIPIIFAFGLAFMSWDGSNPIEWSGIRNFTRLVDDTFFKAALKNTIIYCVGTVPLTMVASLALAIVLNQKVVGRGIFRTLSFFPYVASLVAITSVWKMLFHPSKGPINSILYNVFHVSQENLPQLSSTTFFVVVMLTINCFKVYDVAVMLAGGGSGELTTSATVLVYYISESLY